VFSYVFTVRRREIYEYLRHNIRKVGRIIGGRGIRGTLSRFKLRHREGASWFYGDIEMYVSPADLVTLLPKMFSDTQVSGTTFSASDTLPYFGLLVDTDYNTFEFKDAKVDSWVLRSRAPQFREEGEPDMLYLTLSIIASDRTKGTTWPVSPPSFGTNAANEPYVFSDCDAGVTLSGSTRFIEEFVIVGRNFLYPKYGNSLKPHSLIPRDRMIAARFRVPWNSDNNALDGHSFGQSPAFVQRQLAFTGRPAAGRNAVAKLWADMNALHAGFPRFAR